VETAPSKSDEEIARTIQQGDREVFGVLVERYEEKLLRYGKRFLARKEDITDIVQDVFVSAYQNLQNFDTTKRFSPWIYRIAHNAFINGLRRNERSAIPIDFDTLLSHPVYEDPAESEREQNEMRALIDRGMEKIAPKYREVLVLHYFEELSYKDIAEILQIQAGTVGIRLRRGKEALGKHIKENHDRTK